MDIHKIPRVVAVLVIVVGLLVIVGWYFDIGFLMSIRADWPVMKFISAICFVISGVVLISIERAIHRGDEFSPYISSLASLIILLFMTTILASKVFDISVGMEGLFITEKRTAVKSVVPGQPSLLSALNFTLIATCGFILLIKPKKFLLILTILGSAACLIGAAALTGYAIDVPIMYSYVPGWSNGMSFISAFLFFLIGTSLVLMGVKHNHNSKKE